MGKLEDAAQILAALGLPAKQQNERSSLTLLALAKLTNRTPWSNAQQPMLRTVDIMDFMRAEYGKDYKPNSRETIRRQTLHQFEQARVVDINKEDPSRATNSGLTAYSLTDEALLAIRRFGDPSFKSACSAFVAMHGSLLEAYNKRRSQHSVGLLLPDGETVHLSPGKHNELQASIIEQFGPRFAPGARVLYVGDTAKKHVVCDEQRLATLGVPMTEHDMLPDVILYLEAKRWLFLIEAVTTHGPVSPKRYTELEKALASSSCARVYVSAFREGRTFRKYAGDIAWETEVWIAESPDHMIHFNGPKFLGPYTSP